jgi:hypothetical protein
VRCSLTAWRAVVGDMLGRPVSAADPLHVVALARAMKRRLAGWSPTYFRPREGAEARHAAFLGYLIGSSEHTTVVLEHDGRLVGFLVVVPQPSHRWVDDMYLADPDLWADAMGVIDAHVAAPWITCVSRFDEPRSAAMRQAGLQLRSIYWARTIAGWSNDTILKLGPRPVTRPQDRRTPLAAPRSTRAFPAPWRSPRPTAATRSGHPGSSRRGTTRVGRRASSTASSVATELPPPRGDGDRRRARRRRDGRRVGRRRPILGGPSRAFGLPSRSRPSRTLRTAEPTEHRPIRPLAERHNERLRSPGSG